MAASRSALPEGLLEDVLNEMDITWRDEATDKKYSGFIARGMAYLDNKLGRGNDYTQDDFPRALLMEYVRYARDHALDVFETNYLSMILGAQNDKAVMRFEAAALSCE